MVVYSELPAQELPARQFPVYELPGHELPGQDNFVPIPPAYQRHPSYPLQNDLKFPPRSSDEIFPFSNIEPEVSWKTIIKEKIKALLRFMLRNSKTYVRVLAILAMAASIALIFTPLVMYAKAQKKPNDFDTFPKTSSITTKPCLIFAGVAIMNIVISTTLLILSLMSSKFRKSEKLANAIFFIIAAIGFSSSMGACLYLTNAAKVRLDLWKWSCDNEQLGLESYALNFHAVCKMITLSWDFGLLQAALELYTVLISATAYIILKYEHFVKYGRVGKVF